jgi:hypothetical protein
MTPEASLIEGLLSGRYPIIGLLAALLWWIISRGEKHLDGLKVGLGALSTAIGAHSVETGAKIEGVKTHVTGEANRVIAAIEREDLAELRAEVRGHQASSPDSEGPMRRQPTGAGRRAGGL